MKKVLWISLRAPYDSVPSAGGKVHNFYIKNFKKSDKFELKLLSFCRENEVSELDLEKYNIECSIEVLSKNEKVRKILGLIGLPISLFEYSRVKRSIKRQVYDLKKNGYLPEIIILHWTELVLLLPFVKNIFKESKIIAIEEDVTFLKLQRKVLANRGIRKGIFKIQEVWLKEKEVSCLKKADLVVLNNKKDKKLVVSQGISEEKTFVTVPYYNDLSELPHGSNQRDVIFWGAMNRPENIEAVKWFIENVYRAIRDKIRFVVVGANPPDELRKYEEIGVEITGFVEDVSLYFKSCMCMVVPLQMGAGIKIKVLEGMSAGIPVLTNDIGIEGIYAQDKKEFLYCQQPEDYICSINKLLENNTEAKKIGENAREFIKNNFNMDISIQKFIDRVCDL